MKIRTQFVITMSLFGLAAGIIVISLMTTAQQVNQLTQQQQIAQNIERDARELDYLSNEYLLYGESQQRERWESKFASLSNSLARLNLTPPDQQVLVNDLKTDLERLKAVFADVVSMQVATPSPAAEAKLAFIQASWSRMEVQNQNMVFRAQLLAQNFRAGMDHLNQMNNLLILILTGVLGAYFAVNYLLIFRRTLNAIAKLQEGARIVGSGNLDFVIAAKTRDEIGDLTQAFNQMTQQLKIATASRQEQYSTLRSILESENALIFSVDSEYRYTSFNNAHASVMKRIYNTEIETGHNLLDYMTVEEDREKAKQNLDRALAGERLVESAYSGEEMRSRLYFEVSHSPILAEDGAVIGVAVLSHDITERKRAEKTLEESERRYRELFENASMAIFQSTLDGKVILVNPEFARMFGYESPQEVAATVKDISADLFADPQRRAEIIRLRAEHPDLNEFENLYRRKDGSTFLGKLRLHSVMDSDGRMLYFEGFIEDITERKRMEQERSQTLWYFESMDKVNRAIQGANDLEQMMSDVLDEVLSIFDCDRAFLAHPLDPDAESYSGEMIRCRPEYPTTHSKGAIIPMDPLANKFIRAMLASEDPVQIGPESAISLTEEISKRFDLESIMGMALYPKVDTPWEFAINQCSYARVWGPEEERLFKEIGRRVSDALSSLLSHRHLLASEERFRRLTENAQDVIYRMSLPDGRYEYVSPAALSVFGYSPEEFYNVRDLIKKALHPDWHAYFEDQWEHLTRGEMPPTYEYQVIHKSGEVRWLNQRNILVRDDAGNPIAIEGIVTDITERKQAEEALRTSEARYRVAQAMGHVGNWEYNLQTTEFWGSDEAKRIYGFDLEQPNFTTDEVENCIPERERVHQALIDLIAADMPYNLEFEIRPKNSSKPGIISSVAELKRDEHGNPLLVTGVIQDITERKRAEEALRAANSYNRRLIEASIDPLVTIGPDGKITDMNEATETVTGVSRERLIGDNFSNYFTEPEKAREGYQKVLAAGLVRDYPLTIRHASGETTDVLYNATVYQNEAGEIEGVFAAARDMTERKRAEEALRQSEELLRVTLTNILDPVFITDNDGTFTFICPNAFSTLGYSVEEMQAMGNISKVVGDGLFNPEKLETHGEVINIERLIVDNCGRQRVFLVNVKQVSIGKGTRLYALHDITARKQAEDILHRRLTELELLYENSLVLNQLLQPRDIGQRIIDLLAQKLAWHHTTIRLYHPQDDTLELLAFDQTGLTSEEERRAVEERFRSFGAQSGHGLSGWVIQHGETVRNGDVTHDPRYVATASGIRSGLYVPLKAGERVIGVISIESEQPDAFSADDEQLTATLATQAAIALENARLFDETRRHLAELEALQAVSAALGAASSCGEMIPVIVHQAFDLLQADGVSLSTRAPITGETVIAFGRDSRQDWTGRRFPLGAGILGQVMASGRPYLTNDVRHDPNMLPLDPKDYLQAVACVPLVVQAEVIGALWVGKLTPISDGELRVLIALSDIAANALRRAEVLETLEQRVAERTHELAVANERLHELDRLKSKFVSDVSHELRTPATSLSLYVDLLEHGKPEKREIYVAQLRQQMDRLRTMINEILDLSRLERDQREISLTPIDLNSIVEHVVATQQAAAEAAGLQLTNEVAEQLPLVLAQPEQLSRAVTNLVANAIKYTRAGSVHVVTLNDGVRAGVQVTDTGIGIAPEDLPHVFERFYRGKQVAQSTIPGTGLGLAIVKEIVEAHGGTVEVESELGMGSTFRLWLPAVIG